jgi:hypothetical protein
LKKQLIVLLLLIVSLAACLPSPVTPLSDTSPLPTNSPLPTPTPGKWWSEPCNTPPLELPDGCADFTPIARPPEQIPAPCVRTAYTETVPDNENVDYRLVIRVDHPEYDNVPALPVHILRLPDGAWVVDRSSVQFWDFDCGKDEAPLAWVTWQVLSTGSLTPTEVYETDLPAPFLEFLGDLR